MSDFRTPSQPWFLSITARWCEGDGFEVFKSNLTHLLEEGPLPYYHASIPRVSWHSTVFAVTQFSEFPPEGPADVSAAALFHRFKDASGLPGRLQETFQPFQATAHALRCFDNGTTVQFVDNDDVRAMREDFHRIFAPRFDTIAADYRGLVSLLRDVHKSSGPRLFGSVARSVRPSDGSHLRWERHFPENIHLRFKRVHFLVSDDGLTNLHTPENSLQLGA